MKTGPQALSVSELTHQVRHLLEVSFAQVWVVGEISSFSRPASGHWYFSLKDKKSQVRCAMFRSRNQQVRQIPREGDQVLLRARVSLYEARGDFQLIGESLEPAGLGALQQAFDELKARLEAEGLFASERKRPLPSLPRRIGVVTSATGAAIHDILTVLKRRFPAIPVTLYACPVQGKAATAEIVQAIERANRDGRCDVLIVGRGGGSLEDLWCFNEEAVARAIVKSGIPIVSAVGHEVDITIADLVADLRAPTPSAAAEKLSPDRAEWLLAFRRLEERFEAAIRRQCREDHLMLQQLQGRLKDPQQQLQAQAQRLDELDLRLRQAWQQQQTQRHERLQQNLTRLQLQRPDRLIRAGSERVEQLQTRLNQSMALQLKQGQQRFAAATQQLHLVSPLATLERGYAIVEDKQGRILRQPQSVAIGELVRTRLAGGGLWCRVERQETTAPMAAPEPVKPGHKNS
ncbi:MAG: exodeoxyribonuclease VII large subunit [Oleiphilaceae bacterium]|nr:exodeoxyribonuclease VII large subunit [Oleiphilaceae bacterium]